MVSCKRSEHRCTFEEFLTASALTRRPVCGVVAAHHSGCSTNDSCSLHPPDCCFSTKESSPVTTDAQPFTSDRPGRRRPHIGPLSAQHGGRLVFQRSPPIQVHMGRTRVHLFCTLCQLGTGQASARCSRRFHVPLRPCGCGCRLQSRCQKNHTALLNLSEPRPPTGTGLVSYG